MSIRTLGSVWFVTMTREQRRDRRLAIADYRVAGHTNAETQRKFGVSRATVTSSVIEFYGRPAGVSGDWTRRVLEATK